MHVVCAGSASAAWRPPAPARSGRRRRSRAAGRPRSAPCSSREVLGRQLDVAVELHHVGEVPMSAWASAGVERSRRAPRRARSTAGRVGARVRDASGTAPRPASGAGSVDRLDRSSRRRRRSTPPGAAPARAIARATRSMWAASFRTGEMTSNREATMQRTTGGASKLARKREESPSRPLIEGHVRHLRSRRDATRGTARSTGRPLARDDGRDRASRARRGRRRIGAGRRARHAAPEHHRPGRQPSAGRERGRRGPRRLQRRDLQLPRAAGDAASAAATASPPTATRRRSCTSTRSTAPTSSEHLRGMFAIALWDAAAPAARAGARPDGRQAALLRRDRRTASPSPPRSRR